MFTAKTALKSLIAPVAIVLAMAAAAPAFAQGPAVQFGFQFGNGQFGQHNNGNGASGTRCLSNREVTRGIDASGYDRVRIVRELSRQRVDVTAERGNWVYGLRVDKCTGKVSQPQRLRAAGNSHGFPGYGNPGNGFPRDRYDNNGGLNFQFSFGN